MFFNAYTFKGQVHMFVGGVKILSHSSLRTSSILEVILSPDLDYFVVKLIHLDYFV